MKCPAVILASLCLSLQAFSQQQTLPVFQAYYYRGSSGDDLVPAYQDAFQYDKDGRRRGHKHYRWVEEEKRWTLLISVESDYDNIGNLVLQKSTYWYALTDTIDRVQTVKQKFDTQNRLFEYIRYDEYPRDRFNAETRHLYSYDQHGCNYEIRLKYSFNGGVNYESITTYVMDEQCRTQVMRSYQTSTPEGPHQAIVSRYEDNREIARHEYYVDSDTTLLGESFFDYDQSGRKVFDQRTDASRTYYEFDEDGNLVWQRNDFWDSYTTSWRRSSEFYQSFDSDNNVLVRENYFSPSPTGVWQASIVESFEYNNNGKPSQIHSRSVYDFGSVSEYESVKDFFYRCDGLESETTSTITKGDQLGLANRTVTTYNNSPGCDDTQNLPVVIVPNPTSGLIRLLLTDYPDAVTIHMVSSTGQVADVITTDSWINPLELDVSDLAPGVYIIQVKSEGAVTTGRFVKY